MKELVEYPSDVEMKFSRTFAAPIKLVWNAHADLEQVAKWWGPEGFTITTTSRVFAVGGLWRFTMHGPDGTNWSNRIEYLTVNEPTKLVYNHGSDEDPLMFYVVTEFIDLGKNGTRIESTMKFKSKDERDKTAGFAVAGHESTMGRLEKLLGD